MRGPLVLGGAAVLLAATVAGGVVVATGAEDARPAVQADAPAATAAVEDGPLSAMVTVNGTLTYRARPDGSPYPVINRAGGIYTELPAAGQTVRCGDVVHRVDDAPVVALCGAVPAYRDLEIGDEGRDVRQLNRNLRRLGFRTAPRGDEFTWRTGQALRKLFEAKGVDEPDGTLDARDVVVLPRAGRIAKVTAELGGSARAGSQVAQLTSRTLEVQVQLAASQQGEVRRGDRARITLPGNRSVGGRVARIGTVARTAEEDGEVGTATIPVSIRLNSPKRARGLESAPVQVDITTKGVARALSVPVTALVGKAGAGFGVEVVRAGGRRELVEVEPGLFDTAGGRVEVSGAVRAGDRVVVPAP